MVIDRTELLKGIQMRRDAVEGKVRVVEGLQKFVEETNEFKQLAIAKDELTRHKYDLVELEREYKEVCYQSFVETGDKQQPGGVIKILKEFHYTEEKAIAWAMEHGHAEVLKINVSEFKKVAAALKIPGVDIKKLARMTLSKDLSKWLEVNDEEKEAN